MRGLINFTLLAVVWLVPSCGPRNQREPVTGGADKAQGRDAVLAVVGGEPITVGDFEAEWARRNGAGGMRPVLEERKRVLLEEMIDFKVLLAKALAAGYGRDPEVLARFDELVVAKFREDHLAGTGAAPVKIGDEEARQYYHLNLARFATPAAVRVAIIYFKSSPKATAQKRVEMKARAESVLAAARSTNAAGFSALARTYSDDQATRYAGGDIGWLARGDVDRPEGKVFEQAAFGIRQVGEFAPLVETPQGFYIVRLIEQKAAGARPFEDVKPAIAYQVARERQQQRQEDFLKEMRRGVRIESNPSLLQFISTPDRASDQAPAPLPRG